MLEELFIQLFEKLKTEKENNSITISGCFSFFVIKILEEKFNMVNFVSAKTLTNYYNKYIEGKEGNTGEPKSELKNLISNYLGFEDYTDFENSNKEVKNEVFSITDNQHEKKSIEESVLVLEKETSPIRESKTPIKKYVIATSIILISSLFFFINKYNTNNSETCIIWLETHFEKRTCKIKNTIDNAVYNINIEKFKKVEVTKETHFFKNEKPQLWYGKSPTGKMEYFTHRGVHPETLKELDPITEYIINKYVFIKQEDKTILR